MNLYDFTFMDQIGRSVTLDNYRNQVLLIVNTASKCGFTPQFSGLEKLYQDYKDQKFSVLGFPCNQFANQDPGSNEEILNFCQLNYGVTFPMMAKIDVNGPQAAPLFLFLRKQTRSLFGDSIKWNFTKFLVDREGRVIKRYAPSVKPEAIRKDIEKLLK